MRAGSPNASATQDRRTIARSALSADAQDMTDLASQGREDDQPEDLILQSAAADGCETDAPCGSPVDESLLPRWRRPSLQQARREDPLRADAEAPTHLSFGAAGAPPAGDFERRRIGYRLVSLRDSPDEYRSTEVGLLDQGDEVQLLQRHGAQWLVRCPDGRQGWIHRMTLADPASDQAAAE